MHPCEMHAHQIHAREIRMPIRCTPVGCTPLRYTPVRYASLAETGSLVLACQGWPGLVRDPSLLRVLGQSAKIRQARWGHCQEEQILERRAPTQAPGDAQSVGGCLFGPYRVAVQGLKRVC